MYGEMDDWLEADYEDRNGGAYDPQDDPRAEEYATYDAPDDEDPDEDGPTGCAQCGRGVGETDQDGLCDRCGVVPWPVDANND